jgi:Ca-activated chloride channel family protein
MKRSVLLPLFFFACTGLARGNGLLIPVEPDLPPLAMLNHHVDVSIEDQVAVTKVEQTFRNHTERQLEATYVFPVPEGASVREFAMWVNGHKVKGELLKAARAKEMYASIVRQTKNPALLDYIGSDLLRLKIFPIPPQGDQKVEVSFTAVAKKEHGLVEYVYPLKTDRSAPNTLEEFRFKLTLKSQQPIGSVYSPTHDITINQASDHQAQVQFEQHGAQLDRDFQLFYTSSGQDIGLTALEQRPISDEDGYVMLLVSPRAELSKEQKVPRDIVFVVDTSGSMLADKKLEQAKKALRHCLGGLTTDDRFALVSFATTVERYRDQLVAANDEHIKRGKGWVADLYAGGGTAIDDALTTALEMRSDNADRMSTVVFFTDGEPTIGETDTEKILAHVAEKNTESTRIFTFGLGDDLNAVFLDQIAERSRAISSYVRPQQDIEAKVASFFNKIHHPVLTNLKLSTTSDVRLAEVYPPQLPDLFHGDQLVVLARYQGSGHAAVVLDGKVGVHDKKFVYELDFKSHAEGKPFVEELWARRKVGYLLDQIRVNGEQQELVDEVVRLAKGYGITTPYTSYLIVPDVPLQVAAAGLGDPSGRRAHRSVPPALAGGGGGFGNGQGQGEGKGQPQEKLEDFAKKIQSDLGDLAKGRDEFQTRALDRLTRADDNESESRPAADSKIAAYELAARMQLADAKRFKTALEKAKYNYQRGQLRSNQTGKLGVDLAQSTDGLKRQSQVQATAIRKVANRRCMEIGGVWIDEAFTAKTPTVSIKAQSDAYFRILEQQPRMKEVFQLGNHVVWITPNGTALVIDTTDGKEELNDTEIDVLFELKRSQD